MTNIEERVRKIIVENSDSEKAKDIGLTESLQDFGINSISFVRIVIAIEKEFGISFDDEDMSFEDFQSMQNIINYIDRREGTTEDTQ